MKPIRSAPQIGVRQTRDYEGAVIERAANDASARTATFVASDETVDRYGDIIRVSGWQLDNFRKNATLLYGHQSDSLPLGRVPMVGVEGKRLIAHVEFNDAGVSSFCDAAWAMLQSGALNAVSVGFLPLAPPAPIINSDGQWTGYEYLAQDLLELSVVTVPANPNAIQIAKSFGLTPNDMRRLFSLPGLPPSIDGAARLRTLTLSRLGRHQAAPTSQQGG